MKPNWQRGCVWVGEGGRETEDDPRDVLGGSCGWTEGFSAEVGHKLGKVKP